MKKSSMSEQKEEVEILQDYPAYNPEIPLQEANAALTVATSGYVPIRA
jgi:hypothetical protein